jgi:hypothetical protein
MSEQTYPFSTERIQIPEWIRRRTVHEAVGILARNKEALGQTYTRTIFRIEKETGVLKLCEDLGMMDDVYYGFDGIVGQTQVVWNDQSAIGDGQYSPVEDRINTHMQPPTREAILMELATKGKFPFTVEMLEHELTHKWQFPPEVLKKLAMVMMQFPGLGDKYFPGVELMEVMAYRVTTLEPHEATPATLAQHLQTSINRDGRAAYQGMDAEKVEFAIDAVDSLLALDINALELCKLVYQPGGWDAKSKTYPQLVQAVERQLSVQRQSEEQLPTLKSRYILGKLMDTKKSMEITQMEIVSGLV